MENDAIYIIGTLLLRSTRVFIMLGQAPRLIHVRCKHMEQLNTQSSGETPRRSSIGCVVFLAIIMVVPIVLSFIMRIQLTNEHYLTAIAQIKSGFTDNNFFFNNIDTTLFLILTRDIHYLLLFYNLFCIVGGIIILLMLIPNRKKNLLPMAIPYILLALISLNAFITDYAICTSQESFLYNRISLIGFDIRVMHGAFPVVLYSLIILGYLIFLKSEGNLPRSKKL